MIAVAPKGRTKSAALLLERERGAASYVRRQIRKRGN
jgi:hypothetical protein